MIEAVCQLSHFIARGIADKSGEIAQAPAFDGCRDLLKSADQAAGCDGTERQANHSRAKKEDDGTHPEEQEESKHVLPGKAHIVPTDDQYTLSGCSFQQRSDDILPTLLKRGAEQRALRRGWRRMGGEQSSGVLLNAGW